MSENKKLLKRLIMSNHVTSFETIIESVKALSPAELDALQAHITRSRQKQAPAAKRGGERSVFEIPYDEYLRFSNQEREDLQWRVYREHHEWAETELKTRRAQWIIVCSGEIVEFSRTLDNFPTPEKLQALGEEHGFIPFVFVPKPLIEESTWSVLDEDDFYLTLTFSVAGKNQEESLSVNADLDTGSPHLFVDYDQLLEAGAVDFRPNAEAFIQQHLGEYYRFHIMPIQVAIVDERGNHFVQRLHVYCVRDWQKSSLCLVNPNRQALAGRNMLPKFPVKVELDGEKKMTRVLGKKAKTKKRK
jgi:hypothetical protein